MASEHQPDRRKTPASTPMPGFFIFLQKRQNLFFFFRNLMNQGPNTLSFPTAFPRHPLDYSFHPAILHGSFV
jgi:hypothetical protein